MRKETPMEKLSAPIFNSRVKSDTVTKSEKWLGYLLGPVGDRKSVV